MEIKCILINNRGKEFNKGPAQNRIKNEGHTFAFAPQEAAINTHKTLYINESPFVK